MIRIAKLPYIQEDTNKQGKTLGTFSVVDVQGYIREDTWIKIQEFEGYYLSEGAKEDSAIIKTYMDSSVALDNFEVAKLPSLPNLSKAFGDIKSLNYLFNLKLDSENEDSEYVRSFAVFGEKTLYLWSPKHEEKVKFLKEQIILMNKK